MVTNADFLDSFPAPQPYHKILYVFLLTPQASRCKIRAMKLSPW